MRISIREQLGALVLVSALVGIAVVAVATWITNHNFVLGIRATRLSLTASLKAAQLTSNLVLMESTVSSASTRLLIQSALRRYNSGNNTAANWVQATTDVQAALQGGQAALLLQGQVFPADPNGSAGYNSVVNATGDQVADLAIKLPYNYANGTPVYLGDQTPEAFPPMLYPNFTYHANRINSSFVQNGAIAEGTTLNERSTLLLGPYMLNSTFSLISMTMGIINNTSATEILGWMTIIMDGRLISDVLEAQEGLDQSGVALLVGPNNASNHFQPGILWREDNNTAPPQHLDVRFVMPVNDTAGRHKKHEYGSSQMFDYATYPAVRDGLTNRQNSVNNAGSEISTHNEDGVHVAVGFAMPNTNVVDWIVLVEQSHKEVWGPINHLRNILLACVFGTAGVVLILAFPLAHYFSGQVRRLRDATKRTVSPPGYDDGDEHGSTSRDVSPDNESEELARKEGFIGTLKKRFRRGTSMSSAQKKEEARRRQFNIPSKVKETKHIVQDELTELTEVFNEMCDELYVNYERLEEKVRERTAELEMAKQAAEAANRSKTLFIANISHELKTPLNGILNYAAEAMIEEDPDELRSNAGFIYRSGQILLNLVQDVLTFAQNQSTQLSIFENEFKLRHVTSNVKALFKHQAQEAGIKLTFQFSGPPVEAFDENGNIIWNDSWEGPNNAGRVKDMVLWGDSQRIGQVLINLVSNALKFTPHGGSVNVTVRCIEELDNAFDTASRRSSTNSRAAQGSGRNSRTSRARSRLDSGSNASVITPTKLDTANEINVLEKPRVITRQVESERSVRSSRPDSPPPGRMMTFEFEVKDTGPGVPPELQERIFEPFVQGDLSLSKKHAGTGLGLSICSQLAKLMGGTIALVSDGATGSTFTMRIPIRFITTKANSKASSVVDDERRHSTSQSERARSPANEIKANGSHALSEPSTPTMKPQNWPEPPARLVGLTTPYYVSDATVGNSAKQKAEATQVINEASQRMGKLRILVAEDNEINQKVVSKLVQRYEKEQELPVGVDLTIVPNGELAVEAVRRSVESGIKFDLIFMDIQMPLMDGIEATKAIRALGYSYPILGLSSYSEKHNVDECMEAGMNEFIPKPIDREKLKKAVKSFYIPTTIPEEHEGHSE